MESGRGIRVVVAVFWALLASLAAGQVTYPPRIGERDFVLDEANLLSPEDEEAIRVTAKELLVERDVPIVVVTIPSRTAYGAGAWSIERYAGSLFNEWGIGTPDAPPNANRGMLLLVSAADREARIELGAGWERGGDAEALRIMDEAIVPRFRDGDYGGGVKAGVDALSRLAAGQTFRVSAGEKKGAPAGAVDAAPEGSQRSGGRGILGWMTWPVLLLVVFVVARMLIGRRSAQSSMGYSPAGRAPGYGPMMLPMILGGLGGLGALRGHGSGGVGGGGGSVMGSGGRTFGGGFSGRGGATGRW